jgi:CRP/FNR family transcriptional regulator, cyclic AMP receptor protein
MSGSELLKKLHLVQVFQGLTSAEAGELAALSDESAVAQGTVLFREGDAGETLVVLLEGTVEIVKQGLTLATLTEGAVLGELSLLGKGGARSATATALTPVRLLQLPSVKFRELVRQSNPAALKVVANLAEVMGQRLLLINERFVSALGNSKKEELADFGRILNRWNF